MLFATMLIPDGNCLPIKGICAEHNTLFRAVTRKKGFVSCWRSHWNHDCKRKIIYFPMALWYQRISNKTTEQTTKRRKKKKRKEERKRRWRYGIRKFLTNIKHLKYWNNDHSIGGPFVRVCCGTVVLYPQGYESKKNRIVKTERLLQVWSKTH